MRRESEAGSDERGVFSHPGVVEDTGEFIEKMITLGWSLFGGQREGFVPVQRPYYIRKIEEHASCSHLAGLRIKPHDALIQNEP